MSLVPERLPSFYFGLLLILTIFLSQPYRFQAEDTELSGFESWDLE